METSPLKNLYIFFAMNAAVAYLLSHVGVLTNNYILISASMIYLYFSITVLCILNLSLASKI